MELIVFYSFIHENEYTDYVEELAIKESKEKALLYLLNCSANRTSPFLSSLTCK